MPTSLREQMMHDFRCANNAVITNARCLTEGVDLPSVDMVAFMSPRRSRIDIIQATGRAMRRSPGKKVGYVLVPIYVEQTVHESVAEAVKRAEYDEVWEVLQALQEQDEVLADAISSLRATENPLPFFQLVEVRGLQIPMEELQASISSKCAEFLGTSWDELFGRLQVFRKLMGHCSVEEKDQWLKELDQLTLNDHPSNLEFRRDSVVDLAKWANLQRHLKKKNSLSEHRVRLLDGIEFAWTSEEAAQHREEVAWRRKLISLSAAEFQNSGITIEEIPDAEHESPSVVLMKDEELRILLAGIGCLNEVEHFTICARYGINQETCKTLAEVAAKLNLSRERVRQIEIKSLRKLERILRALVGPTSGNLPGPTASKILRQLQALQKQTRTAEEEGPF